MALFASIIAVFLSLAALVGLAFHVDDQNGSSSAVPAAPPQAASQPAAPAKSLRIGMGEFFYSPPSATAAAGKVSISAVNKGSATHELVLARTNLPAGGLPTLADGSVNEEALNSPGEIADVAAGGTKSTKLDLAPGRYVMFCNLPGHYQGGMYGTLVVK
jgi:uncharacterized cupredoxin-like copper-binding protein